MEEGGAERLGVEAKAGADLRDLDRVSDEVLAGAATLVGVALAGEREGVLDRAALERLGALVGVLLDDREEVAQQRALVVVQRLCVLVLGQRRASAVAVGADPRMPRGLGLGVLYAAASSGLELGFSGWLRYRTHSSLAFSMRRKLIDDERSPRTEDTLSARIAWPLGAIRTTPISARTRRASPHASGERPEPEGPHSAVRSAADSSGPPAELRAR